MRMFNSLAVLAALTVLALSSQVSAAEIGPTVGAQTLGSCAWSHVSDQDRAAILAGYHQAVVDGIDTHLNTVPQIMVARDETLHRAFVACDSNPNIPTLLYRDLLVTQAIQAGAAAELEATHLVLRPHISRTGLDEAWAEAPEASRQCVRASAGKSFGVTDLTCPDSKAVNWFLRKFGLNPFIQSDRPVAEQILLFYHSKAQEEFAEAQIVQIEKDAAAKTAP